MNEGSLISIVALLGWLILAGSALASFRLGWSKILQLALVWLAIFAGLFVAADLLGARLPT
ncbi:hypothetical protein MACH24_20990 [Erythrobacter sp. Dej080120_24]|uniref:hypothetical protein n=1 Tax=Erythrobacter TaxID=1041 RepID=UPI0004D73FA4|nr:hypothetical protein [Erythrobacter aurantius]KEO87208.1 hypothetical protein EH30_06155 [Erythrobacter sp. JL475]BDW82661.1 hypothetical protein MACH24_20990 [Erythrobacter sp. Dej080120_24]